MNKTIESIEAKVREHPAVFAARWTGEARCGLRVHGAYTCGMEASAAVHAPVERCPCGGVEQHHSFEWAGATVGVEVELR